MQEERPLGPAGKCIENSDYPQISFPGTILEERITAEQKHHLSYKAPDPKSTSLEPFQPLMPAKMETSPCELGSSLPRVASLCPTLVPWLRPSVHPVQSLLSRIGHQLGIQEHLPQGDFLGKGRMGQAFRAGDTSPSGL